MPLKVLTFNTIANATGTFVQCVGMVLCFPCLFCAILGGAGTGFGTSKRRAQPRGPPPTIPPNPPPLPTNRRDIGCLPVVEQPPSCMLLQLPLDVRECIYDQVFGGRLITLQVVGSQFQEHCVVRSQCYLPVDDLAHGPIRGILPAPRISIAFLRSCRQVYNEALPILHRRNTFHIWASQLDVVVRSGLGEYCLPDIRSVYIYHANFNVWRPSDLRWETVFSILQQMNLERAAFEFAVEPKLVELDPRIGDSGGHSALGLRNLRRLELWFNRRPVDPSLDKKDLVEKLRKLVLFPGAERNLIFIEHGQL